ncbi:MAG: plastocyanin/azurin family copper-binding protein [Candidatus Gracilibacteria bacterium]|nr:plastocyanin/azurin family copper-binding protein [Candidatus Gracilibacteria bacterium]
MSLFIPLFAVFLLAGCTYTNNRVQSPPSSTGMPIGSEKAVENLQIADVMPTDNPTLGKIFTDGKGMSLYVFSKDTKGVSNCYDVCATNWPPLIINGAPKIDIALISSKFSTITRTDGRKQIAFEGSPLYYFINDNVPGDTNGQGVQGLWSVYKVGSDDLNATPSTSANTQSSTFMVNISNFSFNPVDVEIRSGDAVKWTNRDSVAHQIDFTVGGTEIKSDILNSGDTFRHTFSNPGTVKYRCLIHPTMQGAVIVSR